LEMMKLRERFKGVGQMLGELRMRVAQKATVGKVDAPLAGHPETLPCVNGICLWWIIAHMETRRGSR
jgi:hypothetical protein